MLNHLHIYDRPVDVRAMSLAVADATKYLQLLL